MGRTLFGWLHAALLSLGLGLVPAAGWAHGWGWGWGWRHGHYHHHHHHGWWSPRVIVGVRPPACAWPHVYPGAYGYPDLYDEPEAYIERPSPEGEGWWYYCESEQGYYPRVPSCPEPWVKVPPVPE